MKKGKKPPRLFIFAFSLFLAASAQASPSQLKEGNRLFKKGRYEEALKVFNDALVDAPHSSLLHFNAGDAAYQTGDFSKAEKEFEEASQSALVPLKAAAHYNRGNSLFRQQKWADAVEAYKECLRVNPRDENAKYNLGVALKALKNPPPSKSPPAGQSSNQKDRAGAGQQQSSAGQGSSSSAAGPGEMSREDAERLLAAAASGEMKKSNQKFSKTDVPHPDEDW